MSKFNGNAITWFEVPTQDIDRAVSFYESLLDRKLVNFPGDEPCFMFPHGEDAVSGALIHRPHQKPVADGTMVFLNVDGELDAEHSGAHATEGTVLLPKTMIPGGYGYYACVMDSEGNHIGLHSRN